MNWDGDVDQIRKTMDKVCRSTRSESPLCWDRDQLKDIDTIAHEHWLNTEVMIWVSYAESKIGITFAPTLECSNMNNRWGIKSKKNDDWTNDTVKLPYSWCRLYPFKDMHEYRESLANTLKLWYTDWWCDNLRCLSAYYVWTPWKPKSSWIIRVERFLNY